MTRPPSHPVRAYFPRTSLASEGFLVGAPSSDDLGRTNPAGITRRYSVSVEPRRRPRDLGMRRSASGAPGVGSGWMPNMSKGFLRVPGKTGACRIVRDRDPSVIAGGPVQDQVARICYAGKDRESPPFFAFVIFLFIFFLSFFLLSMIRIVRPIPLPVKRSLATGVLVVLMCDCVARLLIPHPALLNTTASAPRPVHPDTCASVDSERERESARETRPVPVAF